MPSPLPPADPPSSGICSQLWAVHRGSNEDDERTAAAAAKGNGEFDINVVDASTLTPTSSTSAHACLRHPFVRALADGSLPKAAFQFYIAQGLYSGE